MLDQIFQQEAAVLDLYPGFFRWVSAGGEAGAIVETQHAYRVPGSRLLALGPRQESHQGGGDNGGKLRHPA